ncbi:MAG: hypothetical protein BWY78_00984 [Alphaproteobacteria bacterium ADurb.Bin438]|nr:MAG: hypothetical protein BWY78_00984 [Alphaproteobacteria bacterium ADurb.Bin438]
MSILLTRLDYSDQYKDFFNEHNVSHCKLLDATSIFFDKLQKKGTISTKFSARMIASSMHCFLSGLLTEHFRSEKDVMLKDHYGEYIEVFFAQIIN